MKTKILLIYIALLSCRNLERLDMISNKKESFKFINKTSSCYNKNIYYNCFRSRRNELIIFLLGIIFFGFYYQYFYVYSNIKSDFDYTKFDINNYTKPDFTTNYIKLDTASYTKLDTTNNIKLDIANTKFDNFTTNTNNLKSEIENFNDELFCPIIDLEENQDEYRLLSDIKYNQFKNKECDFNDPNENFFIIEDICDQGGLFANLWCLSLYFSDSLLLNRKFLIKMKWKYTDENSCDSNILNRNGLECYFMPTSNCRLDYFIMKDRKKKGEIILNNQSYEINRRDIFFITRYNKNTLFKNNNKKIYYAKEFYASVDFSPDIPVRNKDYYKYKNISLLKYQTIIWSFFMRLKLNIKEKINNIILNELKNQILFDQFNPAKTLSMPIRWGDKCGNNYNRPKNSLTEIDECFVFEEYMNIIKLLQKITDLEYVVLTSESKEIIDKAKNITNKEVKFIFNDHDLMQGSGLIESMTINSNSLKDIFISILSSLKLQLISKYYTVMHASTWNAGIWAYASSGCNPILDLNKKGKLKIKDKNIIMQNAKNRFFFNLVVGSDHPMYINIYNNEKFQKYIILPNKLKSNLNLNFDYYNKYSVFRDIYIPWAMDNIEPAPFYFSKMPPFIDFNKLEEVCFLKNETC